MDKLIVEKLRDQSNDYVTIKIGAHTFNFSCSAANALADEIERLYNPKLRDTEGNLVYKGMEVEGGVVETWSVYSDGSWHILDQERFLQGVP